MSAEKVKSSIPAAQVTVTGTLSRAPWRLLPGNAGPGRDPGPHSFPAWASVLAAVPGGLIICGSQVRVDNQVRLQPFSCRTTSPTSFGAHPPAIWPMIQHPVRAPMGFSGGTGHYNWNPINVQRRQRDYGTTANMRLSFRAQDRPCRHAASKIDSTKRPSTGPGGNPSRRYWPAMVSPRLWC